MYFPNSTTDMIQCDLLYFLWSELFIRITISSMLKFVYKLHTKKMFAMKLLVIICLLLSITQSKMCGVEQKLIFMEKTLVRIIPGVWQTIHIRFIFVFKCPKKSSKKVSHNYYCNDCTLRNNWGRLWSCCAGERRGWACLGECKGQNQVPSRNSVIWCFVNFPMF